MFPRTFVITWLAYFGFYLCRKNFSVLMPFLKTERGYSSQDLAHVLFVFSLVYAVGQFVMGWLVDRLGSRLVVSAGAIVSAASSAVTGTAMPLTLLQGTNGLAQSAGWPGVLKMSGEWFPQKNRAVIMAWWSTHMVLGGFMGSVLAARAAEGHWRRAAWIPAVCLTAIGALFALVSRDRYGRLKVPPTKQDSVILNPTLVSISVMYFCVKLTRYAFLFWLPLYMTENLRYRPVEAGYASSVFELIGFLGVLLAGYLSERAADGARFPVAGLMMFVLALLCAVYPHLSGLGFGMNLVMIGLMGAFTFGPDTLMVGAATQEAARPGTIARAAGFVDGIGSLGQVLSPYVVAVVSARFGWATVFTVLGGIALFGAAVLATQWRMACVTPC